MKVTSEKEISLYDFDAWSGGRDTLNDLTEEQCNTVEQYLEDLYPDGIDETELNDFLWFERDTIAEWLGFRSYEALMNGENLDDIVSELDSRAYKLKDGTQIEFDKDGDEIYGYYWAEGYSGNRTLISSSEYEYDGDIDELAQQIIDELNDQIDDEDIEGCGLLSNLQPRYDSRASFYGKAEIEDYGGKLTLYSYNTPVAQYNKRTKTLTVNGYYSATTARHIREFARQLGIELPKGSDIAGKYKA